MQTLYRVSAFAAVLLLGTVLNAQYLPLSILSQGDANTTTGSTVQNVSHPSLSPSGLLAFDGDDDATTLDDWIYVGGVFTVISGDIVNLGGIPTTATVDNIDDFLEPGHVNDNGQVVWDGDLDNTPGALNDDEVLMLDNEILMQEGTVYPALSAIEDPGEWNSTCVDAAGTVYAEVDMDGSTLDDEILVQIPLGGSPTPFKMNLFTDFREAATIVGGPLDTLVWDSIAFTDTIWSATGHMITDGNLDEVNGVATTNDVVLVRKLVGLDYELLAREGDMVTLPLGQTPLITSFQDPQIATNGDWVSVADTNEANLGFDNIVIGDVGGSGFTVLAQEGQDVSAVTGIVGTVIGFIDATAINANGTVLIACQVEDDGVNIPPYDEMLLQWQAGVLTLLITDNVPAVNATGLLIDIEGDNIALNDLGDIYFEGDVGTNDGIFQLFQPLVFPVDALSCSQTPGAPSVDANWAIPGGSTYDGINVYVDGLLAATLGGAATSFTTGTVPVFNSVLVEVEPFIGVDLAFAAGCSSTVGPVRDFQQCNTPAAALDSLLPPVIDLMTFLPNVAIDDVTLFLDITHTFQADLDIEVTSPSGTTVVLTTDNGGGNDNILTTFADFGSPISSNLNDFSFTQPEGPGTMADFRCELSGGDWSLTVDDDAGGDIGTLNEWCLNIFENLNPATTCCPEPTDVACSNVGACSGGGVAISWTNNSPYAGLELLRDDGVSPVTFALAAGATTYTDATALDGTAYTYTLRYQCAAAGPFQDGQGCSATPDSSLVNPITDLVITSDFCNDEVLVSWNNNGIVYDSIQVFRGGIFVADVTGQSSYLDIAPVAGPSSYSISVVCGVAPASVTNGSVDHALAGLSDFVCTPENLVCDGTVTITWTNGGSYDAIDLLIDGVAATIQPGPTDISYTTGALASGLHLIEMTPSCIAGTAAPSTCNVTIFVPPAGETDVILALEGRETTGAFDPGLVDSVSALTAALQANGATVYVTAPPVSSNPDFTTELPCGVDLTAFARIWVMTGTFPDDYRISVAEGDLLASLNRDSNIPVFIEASDHWGFIHTASLLDDRDGVEPDIGTNIVDGDDSFTQMLAQDSANGLDPTVLFATPVNYGQDQTGTDFTDQLQVSGTTAGATPDADVLTAGAFWLNSNDGIPNATDPDELLPYITAIYAVNTLGAPMISQSFEFGGFGLDPLDPAASAGLRSDLAGLYLAAFGGTPPTGQFVRGNTNDDTGVNIADAIYLLGNLFPGANPPNVLLCLDAADSNNDGGINIADAISLLGSLFGAPAVPLPSPNVTDGCGPDTNASLGCDTFTACP